MNIKINKIISALCTEGKSPLRYTIAWLWIIPTHWDHGRWVLFFVTWNKQITLFINVKPGLMMSMMCVSVHTSVCVCGMCILHVCICVPFRSQFMTRRTSKGSVWSLPQHARTSWSAAWTTSALWRWSAERKWRKELRRSESQFSGQDMCIITIQNDCKYLTGYRIHFA